MEWNLLEKTTFWVDGADMVDAHLGDVAAAAATALGLEPREVMVVDVQPGIVAFDILRKTMVAQNVAGKQEEILRLLAKVPGVRLSDDASIHSEGVLGFIALDPDAARSVIEKSEELGAAVADAVSRRACVFASGSEVIAGNIEDTNSPHLIAALQEAGFHAEFGGIIEDDTTTAAHALDAAVAKGFGLIITTGGRRCGKEGPQRRGHSPARPVGPHALDLEIHPGHEAPPQGRSAHRTRPSGTMPHPGPSGTSRGSARRVQGTPGRVAARPGRRPSRRRRGRKHPRALDARKLRGGTARKVRVPHVAETSCGWTVARTSQPASPALWFLTGTEIPAILALRNNLCLKSSAAGATFFGPNGLIV